MTKADLVDAITNHADMPKDEAVRLVEMFLELIKSTLERGEKVKISGIGTFAVREKKARRGRNPQTGEEIVLDGRQVLTFQPSNVLVDNMNGRIRK